MSIATVILLFIVFSLIGFSASFIIAMIKHHTSGRTGHKYQYSEPMQDTIFLNRDIPIDTNAVSNVDGDSALNHFVKK